jgi:hypothetical protein
MNIEIRKLSEACHVRRHKKLPKDVKPKNVFNPVGVFREKSHDMHSSTGSSLKGCLCIDGGERARDGGLETTANVATATQILIILALAVSDGDKLVQMDVKSAFTQVKLENGQSIWLCPLPGFPDEDGQGLYLELLHHLYGHPEANRAWMLYWVKLLHAYGFKSADRNDTVFYYQKGSTHIHIATIVDDSVISYNATLSLTTSAVISRVTSQLQ